MQVAACYNAAWTNGQTIVRALAPSRAPLCRSPPVPNPFSQTYPTIVTTAAATPTLSYCSYESLNPTSGALGMTMYSTAAGCAAMSGVTCTALAAAGVTPIMGVLNGATAVWAQTGYYASPYDALPTLPPALPRGTLTSRRRLCS